MKSGNKNFPEELKKLQDNKALILLVELMGFLHDVGKLATPKSVEEPFKGHEEQYKRDKENGKVDRDLKEVFEKSFPELLKDEIKDEGVLKQFEDIAIENFQNHHKSSNWIDQLISLADKKDSSEDRGKALGKQIEYKASVFGKESPLPSNLDSERYNFYSELAKCFKKWNFKIVNDKDFWVILRRDVINITKEFFSKSIGDTRRAANDVTLFDHSYMTGSISKALAAKAIINPEIVTSFQPKSNIFHFDKECDLDLLMVSFNGFEFISGGVNLLDIRGRKIVLEEIKGSIIDFLEVEYPIGNCIYEDENNLCFLIAHLEDESVEYLKKEMYEKFNKNAFGVFVPLIERKRHLKYYGKSLTELKEKSEKSIKEGVIKDFIPKWIEEWKNVNEKEKCILCARMPQWKGKDSDYLCKFCWDLRYKVKEESVKGDSPWIDEISDENGRVALAIGVFQPLNRWLSGEFLKYQKIRTLKDIEERTGKKSPPSFEDASNAFVRSCYPEIHEKRDFVEFLKTQIGHLSTLSEDEKRVLGWQSRVGEIYHRLSEENQKILKEQHDLSEEQVEKIARELIEVTTTKPPSPSRLHRVWRELEECSESVIKDSRKEVMKGKRLKITLKDFEGEVGIYDAIIPDIGRIEVFFDKGKEEFNTIERIDINKASDKSIRIEEEEFLEKHVEFEKMKEKHDKIEIYKEGVKKGSFEIKNVDFEDYKQLREILTSPNGFLFVIPANEAFSIVKSIRNEFNEIFSKVLGNISLNVGVMFFHRKFPIYITLDCARRMISEFNSFDFEEGEVAGREDSQLTLKIKDKIVEMIISDELGNGKEDYYYPYLRSIADDTKYIKEINPSDKLKMILSWFDFEFLDSSAMRFNVVVNENKRRKHTIIGENGPRPYLLEDLEKFERLRDIFEAIGSWTPIRDIEALAISKRLEWIKEGELGDKKDVYEELIDSALNNKISDSAKKKLDDWKATRIFLKECIMEGSFFDAIELFKSIMKMELKGGGK